MTKHELAKSVATETGDTALRAGRAIEVLAEHIGNALVSGDQVKLAGFGTFKVRETKARQGRNPSTGETIEIPAKKKVVFVPAKELKGRIA